MMPLPKSNNPLLDFSGLPRFAEIKPEHVAPAIEQLLAENRALVARLLKDSVAAHLAKLRRCRWKMPTSGCRVPGGRSGI